MPWVLTWWYISLGGTSCHWDGDQHGLGSMAARSCFWKHITYDPGSIKTHWSCIWSPCICWKSQQVWIHCSKHWKWRSEFLTVSSISVTSFQILDRCCACIPLRFPQMCVSKPALSKAMRSVYTTTLWLQSWLFVEKIETMLWEFLDVRLTLTM